VSCDGERVTAYVDGALDEAGQAQMEDHLRGCPACREQVDFERLLKRRLAALPAAEPAAGLEEAVRRRLRTKGPRVWRWALPLAAGLTVLVLWARSAAPFVAWELSRDHDHCFAKKVLPAQLWSSHPPTVAAWFERRGTALPEVPESAGGLELVGARYCPLVDRKVAHLYYATGPRHLSLYVVPGPVRLERTHRTRARGNTVRLLRVAGATVGLVSEEAATVEAFERALTTAVAWSGGRAIPGLTVAGVDPFSDVLLR